MHTQELPHTVLGQLENTHKEGGFVIPESTKTSDIYVPTDKLNGAVRRDRVKVEIEGSNGKGPHGRVVEILERARCQVVGKVEKGRRFGFVRPTNPRLNFDVYLPRSEIKEAEEDQIVVAFIERWGDGSRSPEGSISEILGYEDEPEVGILSIIKDRELPEAFPEAVEKEACELELDLAQELKTRLDLRELNCFTIDPGEARDFDDAFSVERLDDDHYRIGVHIADVSHFVPQGSALDQQARIRSNSIYLVDRVLPMLPHHLSSDLCSLVPDKDRLAYSVLLTVNGEAEVKDYELRETLIRSRHRLTYKQAQLILEASPEQEEHKQIMFEVQTLRALAKILQKRRNTRGSLDFDLPETLVDLDDEGFPVDIRECVRLDSMRLVEEFMLLANETVARHAAEAGIPFLYRINLPPEPEHRESLNRLLDTLGYEGEGSLPNILEWAQGRPDEELIHSVTVRSLQKARYSPENQGHFGLAASHYTHFTSPIRRYVDLEVHRMLKALKADLPESSRERLEEIADQASIQERRATEAERDSIALKQVQFMESHQGEVFSGHVSSVESFGLFVRLDHYLVEGLIRVHQMNDDFYEFRPQECCLEGRDTGRSFRPGDEIKVRLEEVDLGKRQLNFTLAD